MLSGFFQYDNPVWRFMGKLGDLIILNVLWVVCSLPVVTIGASTTALYYVTLKLAANEEGYIIPSFFHSFKENFRQSTIIWLLMLASGLILCFDLIFFARSTGMSQELRFAAMTVFGSAALIYLGISAYVFPVQARFYNSIKRTIKNACFMSVRHLVQTMLMLLINGSIVVFSFMIPQVMMLLLLFGVPLLAFINSHLLLPVLKKYMPCEENTQDLKPLFSSEEV